MKTISLATLALVAAAMPLAAQPAPPLGAAPEEPRITATPAELYGRLIQVPTNTLIPGNVAVAVPKEGHGIGDSQAEQRGMRAFNAFNCVGCHMGNGGGGMGPALSNDFFVYGGAPENIYLTIVQGRPAGMPAWGAVLPESVVWDIVAYVKSLSREPPSGHWGTTVSADAPPAFEQVPAELQATAQPWDHTQKFSGGQKP